MNFKKAIILFVGLVLPIGIFLFLKMFGENKFEVQPLFQTELPESVENCETILLPYSIPEEIVRGYINEEGELSVVLVGGDVSSLSRIFDQFSGDPVKVQRIETSAMKDQVSLKNCIFLLHDPYDVVLFDRKGLIRGQYYSTDRDEIDRLILELSILLKK